MFGMWRIWKFKQNLHLQKLFNVNWITVLFVNVKYSRQMRCEIDDHCTVDLQVCIAVSAFPVSSRFSRHLPLPFIAIWLQLFWLAALYLVWQEKWRTLLRSRAQSLPTKGPASGIQGKAVRLTNISDNENIRNWEDHRLPTEFHSNEGHFVWPIVLISSSWSLTSFVWSCLVLSYRISWNADCCTETWKLTAVDNWTLSMSKTPMHSWAPILAQREQNGTNGGLRGGSQRSRAKMIWLPGEAQLLQATARLMDSSSTSVEQTCGPSPCSSIFPETASIVVWKQLFLWPLTSITMMEWATGRPIDIHLLVLFPDVWVNISMVQLLETHYATSSSGKFHITQRGVALTSTADIARFFTSAGVCGSLHCRCGVSSPFCSKRCLTFLNGIRFRLFQLDRINSLWALLRHIYYRRRFINSCTSSWIKHCWKCIKKHGKVWQARLITCVPFPSV